jgi:glutamate racemase
VRLVGSRDLARLAEAHIRGQAIADDDVLAEIAPCFVEEKDGRRTDIVVLACTHYPFLANVFRRLAPWPVDWLDPAEAIARRAMSLLDDDAKNVEEGEDLAIFTTGKPDFAVQRLMAGFGLKLA